MNHPHPTRSSARVVKRHCGPSGIFVFVAALLGTFSFVGKALIVNISLSEQSVGLSSILATPQFSNLARKTSEQLQEQRQRDLGRLDTNKSTMQSLAIREQDMKGEVVLMTQRVDLLNNLYMEQAQRGWDLYFMDTNNSTMMSAALHELFAEVAKLKEKVDWSNDQFLEIQKLLVHVIKGWHSLKILVEDEIASLNYRLR
jgi:hypothetical protein